MFNHEPPDYVCPFCDLIKGIETEYNCLSDVVFQDDTATALIAPEWWSRNFGHVLVVPNKHYENLYDIPDEALAGVSIMAKKMAIAVRRTYGCDGVSIRQHNEPAGDQFEWHLHTHVIPRYEGDELYVKHALRGFVDAETRRPYAEKLRKFFQENPEV